MKRLVSVTKKEDIFSVYHHTPIEKLLLYHNLKTELDQFEVAQLLIGMCMDNRKSLRVPENFAYIIRSGGGSLRYSEFKVSFAIGVGNVSAIALIAHDQCNMVNLEAKKDIFIEGLVKNAGWDRGRAEEHFEHFTPMFEIGNEIDFVLSEAKRLRLRYPKITVAPLMYTLEDNLLYLIEE